VVRQECQSKYAISEAEYKRQLHNPGVTEFTEIPDRGHALTIDDGWAEVAQTALMTAMSGPHNPSTATWPG
jgi:hypothetical protein